MKRLIYCVFISVMCVGCFPKRLAFDPIPCDKFRDCKETIKKVYMLQNPKQAPIDVIVSDEYILWNKDVSVYHNVTGATTVHNQQNTIYFKDIEELRLIDDNKPNTFEIRFINKANQKTYIIELHDKDYAIQGYSAIKCMMDSVKKNSDGLY